MDELKNKMYNYETTPPEGVWNDIVKQLEVQEAKIVPLARKKNYTYYYLAAASVAVILFSMIFFTNRSSNSKQENVNTSSTIPADTLKTSSLIMTVPVEEKTIVKNDGGQTPENKTKKGTPDQKQKQDKANNIDPGNVTAINTPRYITIEGPQGRPVKISSKMATLIDSSETKISSKPIWNKKINEWREIMKVNTLAPTTGNFLDIVELTKTLRDNKQP